MKLSTIVATTALVLLSQAANAAVVITMIGEVQAGNLNGADLAGTTFTYDALVTNTNNIDSTISDNGTFVVDSAVADFGANGNFDFGDRPGFFNWGISAGTFYAYALLTVDVPTRAYEDGFGFSDANTDLTNFDPTQLTEFSPFVDFDQSWTFNTSSGPFSATNSAGDTLVLSQLSSNGVLAVTAVPEPSTLAALLGFLPAFLLRRSRPACV